MAIGVNEAPGRRSTALTGFIDKILQRFREYDRLFLVQDQRFERMNRMAGRNGKSALVWKEFCFPWVDRPAHIGCRWKAAVQHLRDRNFELDGVIERERNVAAADLKREPAVSLQGFEFDDQVVGFGPHEIRPASPWMLAGRT
jgi:hypothetical protein